MSDTFNYNTGWLSEALKIAIPVIWALVAVVFFRARSFFAGDIRGVLFILFWMAVVGVIANVFRYYGHGESWGFDKETFSLKWLQSLGFVIQAILFAWAGWRLAKGIIPELKG